MKIPTIETGRKTGWLLAMAAAVLLAACASNRVKLDYTDYAGEPVKSFHMYDFNGWNAVSKDQLVVYAGMNKAYLLSLTGYCPDLQFANTIAVTSTANTVDRFEKVIVGRMTPPDYLQGLDEVFAEERAEGKVPPLISRG